MRTQKIQPLTNGDSNDDEHRSEEYLRTTLLLVTWPSPKNIIRHYLNSTSFYNF